MKITTLVFCLAGFLFALPIVNDLQSIRIDKNHSNIGFAVPIQNGLSKVRGKFADFKMDLEYDEADITKSTVNVVIQTKSVDTGIDGRDAHLRTADFFDVEKYPEITFKSRKVTKNGDKLVLTGDFMMHGVTKEISFPFKITGRADHDFKEKGKAFNLGFSANLVLNRKEYGVNYDHKVLPNFIGENVEIELNLITRMKRIP